MKLPRPVSNPASVAAIGVCLSLAVSVSATAQTTKPVALPSLGELDHATQQLYHATEAHLVRVLVPIRIASDSPLLKWQSQLDPKLRDQIAAAMARGRPSPELYVHAGPNVLIPIPGPGAVVHIECAGIVLSPRGDVLLPMYVNPAEINELPVSPSAPGTATTAQVRSADRLTGLTIVRMAQPAGEPGRFATTPPATGSVVLLIAATRRGAQLTIWTGDQPPRDSGVIIDAAGEVAGIVRNGHPFYATAFEPIVDQLTRVGEVRRPAFGAKIGDVEIDDPDRPGVHSAMHVSEVYADSPAAGAGIRPDDLIVSLGGKSVADVPTFAAALASCSGRTEVHVLRGGKEQALTVELQQPR